jgi:hypothetical protein
VATTEPLFEAMAQLFRARERPLKGWPDYDSLLDERQFPSSILSGERLERSLAPARLAGIREAIRRLDSPLQDSRLRYGTWREGGDVMGDGEADLVFSHVVQPVVEDQEALYERCARWLKPGGWMSHHMSFTSLGVTAKWNGHLQYGEAAWRIIVGQRPFFVNRERLSRQLALLEKFGVRIVSLERRAGEGGLERAQLAPRWRGMSEDDFTCAYAFVVARKPA